MWNAFDVIAPASLLLALGYGLTKVGYFRHAWVEGLTGFIQHIAVPSLLFLALASIDLAALLHLPTLLGYFGSALLNMALIIGVFTRLFSTQPTEAVVFTMAGTFSNTVFLGIPLSIRAFGLEGSQPIYAIIGFHGLVLLTATAFAHSLLSQQSESSKRTRLAGVLKNVLRNPLIIALLCGLLANLIGYIPSGYASQVLDKLANTTAGGALFALGAALTRFRFVGARLHIAVLCAFKLLVLPAMVALCTLVLIPTPLEFARAAIFLAALPAGINAYLIAGFYQTGLLVNSGVILASMLAGLVTMPVVIWLLGML